MTKTLLELTGSGSLSYSSLDTLLTCGEKYRLTKVLGAPQSDAWYLFGGSAVHDATEMLDKGEQEDPAKAWSIAWEKQMERVVDASKVRAAGRATKANPNKEDQAWWEKSGLEQVKGWVEWVAARKAAGWTLLETEAAFEVTLGSTPVRGYIDRVFVTDTGETLILDLKTGGRQPQSTVQLGVYRQGYLKKTGTDSFLGTYFMTRQGGADYEPTVHSLTHYTEDMLGRWYDRAKAIVEAGLFVPHVGPLCPSCSVAPHCEAVGGTAPTSSFK